MAETVSHAKPKILTIWSLTEKSTGPWLMQSQHTESAHLQGQLPDPVGVASPPVLVRTPHSHLTVIFLKVLLTFVD